MRWIRFLVPTILVLGTSCNFPQTAAPTVQIVPVEGSVTAIPQVTVEPNEKSTSVWTGKTFPVETKNLNINYPDFVDPGEARRHADTLQKAHETYLVIFAFGNEQPFNGQKTTIVFDPQVKGNFTDGNRIVIGSGTLSQIKEGHLNPPDRTFLHEMAHVFENAQIRGGRYYIFNMIIGINEALAEYFVCHPEILSLWAHDERADLHCDLVLHGIGAKSPELTLAYYEDKIINPYTLDWSSHPAGPSGEVSFEQMLARVSDKVGWDVWQRYFLATNDSGGSLAAKNAYEMKTLEMRDPLIKQVFAEFIEGLSQACGQDLRPMFRSWGFEL